MGDTITMKRAIKFAQKYMEKAELPLPMGVGFNRKRYYEYHSGYRPVPPDHEQYIRQAILRYGWTEPVEFNAYVEDYLW